MEKHKEILKEVLLRINPSREQLREIDKIVKEFLKGVKKNIKSRGISAEIFVGGSFAKGTVINKKEYDVDIFIRYGKKHLNEDFSILTQRILEGVREVCRVHGSREYFRIKCNSRLSIEIIPVKRINRPIEAENITDLSYSHVKYINKRVKSQRILDEMKIAKAFCYANDCYGAESYIHGLSGYGLELLVYYYNGFFNLAKAIARSKGKIVIDIEKFYKKKEEIFLNINSSKLDSPIILIDPTYKQRNVLASLSDSTFKRFREKCKEFVKKPDIGLFEKKRIDLTKEIEKAERRGENFIHMNLLTSKQEGDIAGSKLLKFFNHLEEELKKRFILKKNIFVYSNKKDAEIFLSVRPKKNILIKGPREKDKMHREAFLKEHKCTFIRRGRVYAREEPEKNIKKYVSSWIEKNSKKIQEMSIEDIKIF